jgi:hypothetical protein
MNEHDFINSQRDEREATRLICAAKCRIRSQLVDSSDVPTLLSWTGERGQFGITPPWKIVMV